ncbi:hypothetical protein BD626DRAFT_111315 [Schizophyllum amplum]|uniref:REJ domain-containing protein n=1 Tax=Schizophyllum amplum TaxID=97359 RepID=A0A550CTK3_9AGAR|nr:hypothetical protein BD626DRAFT_111315 [Auriculariopsis ampla]
MFASVLSFVPLTFILVLQLGFTRVSGAPSFPNTPSMMHRRYLAARQSESDSFVSSSATDQSTDISASATSDWSSESATATESSSSDLSSASPSPSPSPDSDDWSASSESWDSTSAEPSEASSSGSATDSSSATTSSVLVETAVATAWDTYTSVYTASATFDTEGLRTFTDDIGTTLNVGDSSGTDSVIPASPSDSAAVSTTESTTPPVMTPSSVMQVTTASDYSYEYRSGQTLATTSAAAAASDATSSPAAASGSSASPVSAAAAADTDHFWSNTGAVAGTFAAVGVVICIILFAVGYYKRSKARPRTIDFGRFSKLPETKDEYPQEKAPAPPAPAYSAAHYQQEQVQEQRRYRDVEERDNQTYEYGGYNFAMVSGYPALPGSPAPMPVISPLNARPRRTPSPPSLTPTRRAPSPPDAVRYNDTRTPSPTTPPVTMPRYQPPSTYDLFSTPPPAPRPVYNDGRVSPTSKYSDDNSFYGDSPTTGRRTPRGGF